MFKFIVCKNCLIFFMYKSILNATGVTETSDRGLSRRVINLIEEHKKGRRNSPAFFYFCLLP